MSRFEQGWSDAESGKSMKDCPYHRAAFHIEGIITMRNQIIVWLYQWHIGWKPVPPALAKTYDWVLWIGPIEIRRFSA